MTKRNPWGTPIDETVRNAFGREVAGAVPRNAWGRPVAEPARNPWGREIRETARRNAWGRVLDERPKAKQAQLTDTTTAPEPNPRPSVERPAIPPSVSSFPCGPDGARTILNDGKGRTLVRGDGSKVLLSEGRQLVMLEESTRLKLYPVAAG